MYEDVTFESILERMLDRVSDDYDKREGSVIYDALAPAAVELQLMYIEFDRILNESFADTASREYLIKRASERGLAPLPATKAILQGVFTGSITSADVLLQRFNIGDINYIVTEVIDEGAGTYKVQCETPGTEGNRHLGDMLPINYIAGLETAELTAVLIPGEDEEPTEDFRERYFNSFDSQSFGGNIADYKEKTNAIAGVGGVKVYPVWDGGGTVKLVIINSEYKKPTNVLISTVQETIDPTQDASGLGLAPIGHIVTVAGVEETTVNINFHITYQSGWDWEALEPYVLAMVDDYFTELSGEWADSENIVVRISQLETRLLNITGVLDVADTTINGVAANLTVPANNIPIRGEVTDNG